MNLLTALETQSLSPKILKSHVNDILHGWDLILPDQKGVELLQDKVRMMLRADKEEAYYKAEPEDAATLEHVEIIKGFNKIGNNIYGGDIFHMFEHPKPHKTMAMVIKQPGFHRDSASQSIFHFSKAPIELKNYLIGQKWVTTLNKNETPIKMDCTYIDDLGANVAGTTLALVILKFLRSTILKYKDTHVAIAHNNLSEFLTEVMQNEHF